MGLYINHNNHDGIFKNNAAISAPNQGFFIRNHMEEMIQSQQKVNASLEKAIIHFSVLQKQQDGEQQKQWAEIEERLQQIQKMSTKHEKAEDDVLKQLRSIEDTNAQLTSMVAKRDSHDKEKIEQMYTAQQKLLSQMQGYESEVQQLVGTVNEQAELHQALFEKVDKQQGNQEEVLERLENQEALSEKMLRQFEHFRSSLFERTTFLAEKVEESAKFTSAYMTKLFTGKDQPMTLWMMERNKDAE